MPLACMRPGLFFTYRFNPNLVARAAYTNTLARPGYGDLIPYRVTAAGPRFR